MIKIICLPIHLDVAAYVRESQATIQEATFAYQNSERIFEGTQVKQTQELDTALNEGYAIIDKQTIVSSGATKNFYVLYKKPFLTPPPEQHNEQK